MKPWSLVLCALVLGSVLARAQVQPEVANAPAPQQEKQGQGDHPYYRYSELADAQAAARKLHQPLAWLCGSLAALSASGADLGSEDEITRMSVDYLKSRAVIIFLDGGEDYGKAPPTAMDQFNQLDDGAMPGGHHFYVPKIVFTDADGKLKLGRAWYSEMKDGRETVIAAVLQAIAKDSAAQAALNGKP
jgi:hypothetical protein